MNLSGGRSLVLALIVFASSPALAGPMLHLSRTTLDFVDVAREFTSPPMPVYVVNQGDAALLVTGLTLGGMHPQVFHVSGTCTVPISLAPAEFCRIDVVNRSDSITGSVSATLTIASNSAEPAPVVSLLGSIEARRTGVPFIVPVPPNLEFGERAPGTSSTMEISFTNLIPGSNVPPVPVTFNFAIQAVRIVGDHPAEFSVTSPCLVSLRFFYLETCVYTVAFAPAGPGLRTAQLFVDLVGVGSATGYSPSFSYSLAGVGTAPAPVNVVEYYNATLDHYFITWLPTEIAALDAGVAIRGWTRTGQTFKTLTFAGAATTPVCRYYIPPAKGDSHFFGRGVVECAGTGTRNPTFVLEDPAFMHMQMPAAGVCPPGTVKVYRVFSNRPDANHRYMVDPAIRDQMVVLRWLAEGDGPDLVVMCAPA